MSRMGEDFSTLRPKLARRAFDPTNGKSTTCILPGQRDPRAMGVACRRAGVTIRNHDAHVATKITADPTAESSGPCPSHDSPSLRTALSESTTSEVLKNCDALRDRRARPFRTKPRATE